MSENYPKHIVITVHGIRTFGQWQNRLNNLVRSANQSIGAESYHYGYFSVIAFVIPIFRWFAVLTFRKKIQRLFEKYPNSRYSFVAHSFGTHLVAHSLRKIDVNRLPKIDTIILGSGPINLVEVVRSA